MHKVHVYPRNGMLLLLHCTVIANLTRTAAVCDSTSHGAQSGDFRVSWLSFTVAASTVVPGTWQAKSCTCMWRKHWYLLHGLDGHACNPWNSRYFMEHDGSLC